MKRVRMLVASALLAAAGAATSAAAHASATLEFNNPVLRQRADPHVTLHTDGWYYYAATVPEYNRLEIRRTRDLNQLAEAERKVIWRKHAKGQMGAHIWAPEIHHIDGKWYIYFTAGEAEKVWEIRPYVMVNESANPLQGEWKELGRVNTGWESFSLDATTFAHQGQRYYVWTQRGRTPEEGKGTNIYIAKMKNPTTLEGPAVLLTKPDYAWEKVKHEVNEAPSVLIRNGKVFMTYSAAATDASYSLGLLTAPANANLLDPKSWTKSPEPVFKTSEKNGMYGPGHNSFTTTPDGKTDLLVYHARDYRDIKGDSLRDPNRHTRVQVLGWKADGTPDFGEPVADQGKVAPKPLFRDPIHDGAADPVLVYAGDGGRWIMFYTNRRANVAEAKGVAWVHGTHIGMAESTDGGATWQYIGKANIELPAELGGDKATHWAPEIVRDGQGLWHMFLTVVPGVFDTWAHPRHIVHLTSMDLRNWNDPRKVALVNDKVIDAAVARLPEGGWRMWYNNEADKKSIYYADSPDLETWTQKGKAVGDQSGEGPKVFRWQGKWWMVTDVWRGLGVYRSDDALNWTRQPANLLQQPGKGVDDQVIGGHPDVVVSGDRAWLFYFTHPGRTPDPKRDDFEGRRSSLQVVELKQDGEWLKAERDLPTRVALPGK